MATGKFVEAVVVVVVEKTAAVVVEEVFLFRGNISSGSGPKDRRTMYFEYEEYGLIYFVRGLQFSKDKTFHHRSAYSGT